MRLATMMVAALLSGCSASGQLAPAQADQRESVGAAVAAAPSDASALIIFSCWGRPGLQDLWRKAPLAANWLGSTIPASSFVADNNAFVPNESFFVVPNGDRGIPDVVLGSDVEATGPDGDKAFEFSDENGKKVVVTIPPTTADKQVYRVPQCR